MSVGAGFLLQPMSNTTEYTEEDDSTNGLSTDEQLAGLFRADKSEQQPHFCRARSPNLSQPQGSIISSHRWESADTLWDHNDAI